MSSYSPMRAGSFVESVRLSDMNLPVLLGPEHLSQVGRATVPGSSPSDPVVVVLPEELRHFLLAGAALDREARLALEIALARPGRGEVQQHRGRFARLVAEPVNAALGHVDPVARRAVQPL